MTEYLQLHYVTSVVLWKFSTERTFTSKEVVRKNDSTDSLNFQLVSKTPLHNSNTLFVSEHVSRNTLTGVIWGLARGDTQESVNFNFFTYLIFSPCSHTIEINNLIQLKIFSPTTFQMQPYQWVNYLPTVLNLGLPCDLLQPVKQEMQYFIFVILCASPCFPPTLS